MPLILAIEPDRRQASQLAALVRIRLDAELLVADTIKRAVSLLRSRLPDLILISPLLSASDEAALAARLGQVDRDATHVRMLRIPALARQAGSSSTSPSRRRRTGAKSPGCDPSIFAAQIADQLERGGAERALHRAAADAHDAAPVQTAAAVAETVEEIPPPIEEPLEEDIVEDIVAAPVEDAAVVEPADEDEAGESAAIVEAVEIAEAAAPREAVVVVAAPRDEDARELWSALPADDSRVWPPLEGVSTYAPQIVVALERLEIWAALPSGLRSWPPIEGIPAHDAGRAQPAAAEHGDLLKLVAELRREISALRLLHADPLAPAPADPAPRRVQWGAYDPGPYGVPALIVRLDTPHDLPDDPPATDRPS